MERDLEGHRQEEGGEEEMEEADVTNHPKRNRRILIFVIFTVVVLVALTLGLTLSSDDNDVEYNPYEDILSELRLERNSSGSKVEQAMVALADHFLTTCPAGISIGVTRKDTRITVPLGILNIQESVAMGQDSMFEIGSHSLY